MLFKSHNDLLEEFTYFLPDATPPALQSAPVKKITARARQANRGEHAIHDSEAVADPLTSLKQMFQELKVNQELEETELLANLHL